MGRLVKAAGFVAALAGASLAPAVADAVTTTPQWTHIGEVLQDQFGNPVAAAGDVNGDGFGDVIVSSPQYGDERGKVYLFLGSASGLEPDPVWDAVGESTSGDRFGYAIASAGDLNGDGFADIAVTSPTFNGALGKVYVYYGEGGGLPSAPSWTVEGTAENFVGTDVAAAGDVNGDGYADLLIGRAANTMVLGRAYVYLGGPNGLSADPFWTVMGEGLSDYFGGSVSGAGDVNGDGFDDVLVGASEYGGTLGKVYLYLGSASGVETTPVWTASSSVTQGIFGWSLSAAGDLNQDGYDDIAVGSVNLASVFLYAGGPGGPTALTWTVPGPTPTFGYAISGGADVNGDGRPDLIVGEPYNGAGGAYVFLGEPGGPALPAAWSQYGEAAGDRYGLSAASAGDVDGDGATDVIVGAPFLFWAGKSYVYHGVMAPCTAPTLEVFISTMEIDANGKPVLHFADPNPPANVTGYNVYRAAQPQGPWTLLEQNAQDAYGQVAGIQYVDGSGDVGDLWYYEIAPWSSACSAEGPR